MKKTTVLMAAVLAAATVLTAGLTVLPRADPCSNNINEGDTPDAAGGNTITTHKPQICIFEDPVKFKKD